MIRKTFFPRAVSSTLPFRSLILVARFTSASSPTLHPSASYHSARDWGEESKNVRVSVWWDFENCHVPSGANVLKVAQIITAAVRANGIKGPVQITAFGDVFQLSRDSQSALSMTGVNINHIPRGGKNSADRSLLMDLMYWVSQNPPPAHLFLISGDSDFASILHRLRMNNYNILLACTDTAPSVLCSAASIMWQWPALIKEEKLIGRYFNQPPDGLHGSWYGHYRVPLENPFSFDGLQVEPEETCDKVLELNTRSVPKGRPVPPTVLKQISHILSLHPRGIPITDFRDQLMKANVKIQNDFYGYKKFTQFLQSMPQIVELIDVGHGMFMVHGVNMNSRLSVQANDSQSSSKVTSNQEPENIGLLYQNQSEKMKSSMSRSAEVNDQHHPVKMQPFPSIVEEDVKEQCPKKVEQHHTVTEATDAVGARVDDGEINHLKESTSGSNSVIIKTIWNKWFAGDRSQIENTRSSETLPPRNGNDLAKKGEVTLEDDGFSSKTDLREKNDTHPQKACSQDESCAESAMENKTDKSLEAYVVKGPRMLARIGNWFRSRSNPNPKSLDKRPQKDLEKQKPGVFSKDSFWKDIEDFILSPEGSHIISRSMTREQMALKLQRQGPSAVRSLNEEDALMLVDLLISEKRWVEESPSASSPFELTRAMNTSSGDPRATYNRLSTIFSSMGSESKRNPDERIDNVYDADIPMPVRHKLHALNLRTDCELSDSSQKDGKSESLWEELGPVIDTSQGRGKVAKKAQSRYEPPTSDDYFSDSDCDSEGESRYSNSPISQMKPKSTEEHSSLFQILDSCYAHHQECENTAVSTSGKVANPATGKALAGTKTKTSSGIGDQHARPQKHYDFVPDPVVDNKDKLIDVILGSLKKSSDSNMHA